MKKIFLSAPAKIMVDIFMVIGLLIAAFYSHLPTDSDLYWKSPHCITGLCWFLLILMHMMQHWPVIRALTKKRVRVKNKITCITLLASFLMGISIILFMGSVGFSFLKFHGIAGRLFGLMIVIHTIQKYKRFISLFLNIHRKASVLTDKGKTVKYESNQNT